jgi:hypothetical protein
MTDPTIKAILEMVDDVPGVPSRVTYEQACTSLETVVKSLGHEAAVNILASYDVTRVSELEAHERHDFCIRCAEALVGAYDPSAGKYTGIMSV